MTVSKRANSPGARMTRRQVLKGMAATAAVAGTTRAWAGAPAVRAETVTLQYMTANLTEKQYEPI